MANETKLLAEFAVNLNFNDLPKNVIDYTKICILDLLGSIFAGSRSKPTKIIVNLIKTLGGINESTVISYGFKTNCLFAALANGVMAHIVEMDDVHKGSIMHPGAPIIPAALAIAEREKVSGKDLITSIVAGYEVAIRIGEAVGESHYKYWHTTGTCGTFGAAIAAGKILNLNVNEMADALGNAGTQASGLWQFIRSGAMSKHLHAGKAAFNGLLSALLAKNGFTGAKDVIEGEMGFCKATSQKYDLTKITNGLGSKFKIIEVSIKPYASCRHTHSTIDAILMLKKNYNFKIDDIKSIKVRTYNSAIQIANNPNPQTPYEAKFSLQYCIAIALIKGEVGLEEFNQKLLFSSNVRNLMSKVKVESDPKLNEEYPVKWPSIVEIELVSGKTLIQKIDYPLGDPENPINYNQLISKFSSLSRKIIDNDRINEICSLISKLEKLDDISLLTELLI